MFPENVIYYLFVAVIREIYLLIFHYQNSLYEIKQANNFLFTVSFLLQYVYTPPSQMITFDGYTDGYQTEI